MFDEPSSYLDVMQRLKAARAIRSLLAQDTYVICVEHDLSVLDYQGRELPMRTLSKQDETAAYNSNEHVVWLARALNGQLLLELSPVGVGSSTLIAIEECAFRFSGAAAILAATAASPGAPMVVHDMWGGPSAKLPTTEVWAPLGPAWTGFGASEGAWCAPPVSLR